MDPIYRLTFSLIAKIGDLFIEESSLLTWALEYLLQIYSHFTPKEGHELAR